MSGFRGSSLAMLLILTSACSLGESVVVEREIQGFVWLDKDADGIKDPDEAGIEGASVSVTESDDKHTFNIAITDEINTMDVTDQNGAYTVTWKGNVEDELHLGFKLPPTASVFRYTDSDVGNDDSVDSDVIKVGDLLIGETAPFRMIDYPNVRWSAGVVPSEGSELEVGAADSGRATESVEDSTAAQPTATGAAGGSETASDDSTLLESSQIDPIDGCRDMNAAGQFDCSADIERFEAAYNELANQFTFTFVYAVPIDLTLLESCVGFDLDRDPTTGSSITFDIGADVAACFSGLDSVAYLVRYAASGSFAGSNDLSETDAVATQDTDPVSGLTRALTLLVNLEVIDKDAHNATLQAEVSEPPTMFDLTEPILSPAAQQGQ